MEPINKLYFFDWMILINTEYAVYSMYVCLHLCRFNIYIYIFVDQLSIFHLSSMTYYRRLVNEPFEGATMNCNLVIYPSIWCSKQSWLGGRASVRHVSRNKLYLAALTQAKSFCTYVVHTNFSTSGRMSSGTSQPHLRVINAEQKASNSSINQKGFVFPFPLKALMLSHPVKKCVAEG